MIFQDFEECSPAVAVAPQGSKAVNNISHKAVIPPREIPLPHRSHCGHKHGNRHLGIGLVWESIAASPLQHDRYERRRRWETMPTSVGRTVAMLTTCMYRPPHLLQRQERHHRWACRHFVHGAPYRPKRAASAALR